VSLNWFNPSIWDFSAFKAVCTRFSYLLSNTWGFQGFRFHYDIYVTYNSENW
jgi:hypothetical protein